jgi:hypothetical protein
MKLGHLLALSCLNHPDVYGSSHFVPQIMFCQWERRVLGYLRISCIKSDGQPTQSGSQLGETGWSLKRVSKNGETLRNVTNTHTAWDLDGSFGTIKEH